MDPDAAATFVDHPDWVDRARRWGPLQYSALGDRRLEPPGAGLAGWVADFLDRVWDAHGRPDPFIAVVVSGDRGELARAVLELGPLCLTALRYVLVEPHGSAASAEAAVRLLPLEEPAFLFPSGRPAPGAPEDFDVDPDDPLPPAAGIGPLTTYLTGMPTVSSPEASVVVAAVEVLGRMASDRVEWRDGGWCEIRLAAAGGELVEMAVPLPPGAAAVPVGPPDGGGGERYAVLTGATAWLGSALRRAPSGLLAVVDHWTDVTEPLPHVSAIPPVALDQLRRVRDPVAGPEPLTGGLSVVYWRIG